MKRFFLTLSISIAIGILISSLLNLVNIKPLNFYGNDPNSNTMIFGIIYLLIGGLLLGMRASAGKMNIVQQVQYAKDGYTDDVNNQNRRFPIGIALVLSGILFIILYFILNRITLK